MGTIFQADKLTITLGRRGRKWRQFSKELKYIWRDNKDSIQQTHDKI